MKINRLLLILILPFFLTGCLNYTELNDVGIINTLGIDKNDKNYIIDINMLTPTTTNLEENKTYQVEAPSLNEAFDKLYLLTSKDINLSHLELLILSKNIKKEDYDNITNFFLNREDSRNNFNTIILENYKKDNIFKFDSKDINSLIETNHKEDGIISPVTFDNLAEDILNIKISYIPTIKIEDNIEILGYRNIYKENKLLSLRESISYNFLTNKITKCNLVDENLNIKIDKSTTSLEIQKNKIKIKINSTLTNYGKSKNPVKDYNSILKNYIHEYLDNNDLEYFKDIIKKHDYNYYKNNRNMNIQFTITIDGKLNKEAKTNE